MDSPLVVAVMDAANVYVGHYPWRRGQAAFNALNEIRPDLANEVRGTHLDPFYVDANLPAFIEWLEQQ